VSSFTFVAILLSGLLLGPLQANPLLKYYSFEIDEEFARIARRFIDLAGLNDTIVVIVGPTSRILTDFGANVLRARGEYTLALPQNCPIFEETSLVVSNF
jgi:predicted O-methyltransferase YrrM